MIEGEDLVLWTALTRGETKKASNNLTANAAPHPTPLDNPPYKRAQTQLLSSVGGFSSKGFKQTNHFLPWDQGDTSSS